jgi:hypothetical protein
MLLPPMARRSLIRKLHVLIAFSTVDWRILRALARGENCFLGVKEIGIVFSRYCTVPGDMCALVSAVAKDKLEPIAFGCKGKVRYDSEDTSTDEEWRGYVYRGLNFEEIMGKVKGAISFTG